MEQPQIALSSLLTHLPLLRPGNKETSDCYLTTIRQVLSEFITPPYRIYNECVEIMSYVFVHPAFDKEEKKSFKHLLKQVLNKVSPENFVHSPVNESSDESVSPNPEIIQNLRLNRRSNSLTPAHTNSPENLLKTNNVWSSQENLANLPQKPRSYSLSSDKTVVINIPPLIQSSSSETRLQDIQGLKNLPIMKSILSWLKSLRLHKYSWVFNNLTYNQMLNLDDATLQNIGITKGARHKLLLSIGKLRERSTLLMELETEVMNGGDLNLALKKLKGVLQSPMLVTAGEDLPSQFIKVMGKVCTQLLMLRQCSDETLLLFSCLCEKVDTSEAFTDEQKRKLHMWLNELTKATRIPVQSQRQYNKNLCKPHNIHAAYYQHLAATSSQTSMYAQKSSSYPNMQNKPISTAHRHSAGSITLQNQLSGPQSSFLTNREALGNRINSTNSYHHRVSFKQEHHAKHETSATTKKPQTLKNHDIESSLQSLCLQMMEHALGP